MSLKWENSSVKMRSWIFGRFVSISSHSHILLSVFSSAFSTIFKWLHFFVFGSVLFHNPSSWKTQNVILLFNLQNSEPFSNLRFVKKIYHRSTYSSLG